MESRQVSPSFALLRVADTSSLASFEGSQVFKAHRNRQPSLSLPMQAPQQSCKSITSFPPLSLTPFPHIANELAFAHQPLHLLMSAERPTEP